MGNGGRKVRSFPVLNIIPSPHTKKAFFLGNDLIIPSDDYEEVKQIKTQKEFLKYLMRYANEEGEILRFTKESEDRRS